ncbi:MAG: SDR family oxidoreductase [Erysipelotrichaceae bacterium]|nr:SDR family oxidoreductase [Erysipelotrichaceae bacterium]
MKVLVTGALGFVGKNLVTALNNIKEKKDKTRVIEVEEVYEFDINTDISLLDEFTKKCDFVFHLAGVNRPKDESEFMEGNFGFTNVLLDSLKKNNNKCPVMISSSTQAALDNPYGLSKRKGEELMFSYGKETCAKVLVYRFPNVFGMGCRPNYNSFVTTMCYNIANDLPISINSRDTMLTLVYVGDIVEELILALSGDEHYDGEYAIVPVTYQKTLGEIADLLYSFKSGRNANSENKLATPNVKCLFSKKLYSTFTSYLPKNEFSYDLKMNCDHRGSFTEILRTEYHGQFSVNISEPGITKGFHYHTYAKVEKFVVVSGTGLIRFRKPDSDEIIEYYVTGEKIQVVDIPLGYTHEIVNLSKTDKLITFMWCNECFDPEHPDTYFLEVGEKHE